MNDLILPSTDFIGKITVDDKDIRCAVLFPESDNPQRVLVQREIVGVLTGNKKGGLSRYLQPKNLQPYIPDKFKGKTLEESTISFILSGRQAQGFLATDLIDFCHMYLKARNKGALLPNQLHLAEMAEVIILSFAKTGIIAVIDEVTGYQDIRVKNALEKILNQFLLEEAKKYQVTFPLELYKEWFRLNNWDWKEENAQRRPSILGKWTNTYIYERMAPDLLKRLELKNPKSEKGYRKHKHFQFLTDDIGEPKLREFFGGHIALAKATSTWRKYISMVEKVYPRFGHTMQLPFADEEE